MRNVFLTVDLGFGDAGKGSMVDFLVRAEDAHTVVRYNGGAQAAHRVVTADGRAHIFSQFGSGTLAGARTHLSRFMLLDPLAMATEAQHLQGLGVADPLAGTTIDRRAPVITPFHRAINRLRELARGDQRHGSCGVGIGETMIDFLQHGEKVIFAGDLARRDSLAGKLRFVREVNLAKLASIQDQLPDSERVDRERDLLLDPTTLDWLMDAYSGFAANADLVAGSHLHNLLRGPGTVIFEGAQGVLLDEWRGFHPHTTWSTTTLANADQLLAEAGYTGNVTRLGITRAYTTRHGAGPLVSEDAELTHLLPDRANVHGEWQQGFRVGWLDLVLLRYALDVVGRLDGLAVTCLDRLSILSEIKLCAEYQLETFNVRRILPGAEPHDLAYQTQITRTLARCQPIYRAVAHPLDLLPVIEDRLGTSVRWISCGERAADKSPRSPS
ncbi:MAG: adenylosuccinate synthetase [Caldilineaceae bacterium]|nr:adenylosuccinate synthetase [Caldilineaceae bacterium]